MKKESKHARECNDVVYAKGIVNAYGLIKPKHKYFLISHVIMCMVAAILGYWRAGKALGKFKKRMRPRESYSYNKCLEARFGKLRPNAT